jgi:hypothetical protein
LPVASAASKFVEAVFYLKRRSLCCIPLSIRKMKNCEGVREKKVSKTVWTNLGGRKDEKKFLFASLLREGR